MTKKEACISANAAIPAYLPTSRHKHLSQLYSQAAPSLIDPSFTTPIKMTDDHSPPRIDFKKYKHGSATWPCPAIGSKALKSPPPVG